MKLNELTADYITKKVLMCASDGNKVVRHNKEMREIAPNIYAGKPDGEGYSAVCNIYMCFDGLDLGLKLMAISTQYSIEEVVEAAERYGAKSRGTVLSLVQTWIRDGQHIPMATAYFVAQFKPELWDDMMKAREEYAARREQAKREQAAKRAAEELEFVAERNAEAEVVVQEALEVLRKGGVLANKDVTFYEDRYNHSTYSVVNYLCRKYGAKLPLRTQGWVNDSLATLIIKDGKCEQLQYYKRTKSARPSEVIYGYINQLIEAVKGE